jgi:fumarylacetoacetate (FAA) hydrolase
MKMVCYIKEGHDQLAILAGNTLYDMDALHPELPSTMSMFLNYWDDYFPVAKAINESIAQGKISLNQGLSLDSEPLISPVPLPASCRRAIVFNDQLNSLGLYPDDTKPPASFHFINHHSVRGVGDVSCMLDHFEELDFEMGVALVVSSHCRNIIAEEANQYIGGYMIMNKIIVQNKLLSKDIANVLGPWLVTADELEPFRITRESKRGNSYNLKMACKVNGKPLINSNLADMEWTFAEILESCAYGSDLQPGDIIGTGAIVMGCYLNLNHSLTGKQEVAGHSERWLQKDDIVEIEIKGLGILTTTITAENSDFSLQY